jgi:hypothetical protein
MIKRLTLLAAALLLAAVPALCQAQQGSDMGGQVVLPPGHPPIDGHGGPAAPTVESPGSTPGSMPESATGGPSRPMHWNPNTVESLEGRISAIGPAMAPGPGQQVRPPGALMIALDSEQGTRQVVLGPAWFLYQQEPKLKLGDHVKVTGSVVSGEGRSLMLAQKVEKNGQTLTLRDEQGRPAWAGGRHGAGMGGASSMSDPGASGGCPMMRDSGMGGDDPGGMGRGGTQAPEQTMPPEQQGGVMQPSPQGQGDMQAPEQTMPPEQQGGQQTPHPVAAPPQGQGGM